MDALSFSLNGPLSLPCAGLMGDSDHPYSKFENEWSGRSGGAESFPSLLASSDASFSQTSSPDRMLDPPHQSLWFTCLIISILKIEMKLYFAFRFLFCVLRVDQMLNLVLKVPFFFLPEMKSRFVSFYYSSMILDCDLHTQYWFAKQRCM